MTFDIFVETARAIFDSFPNEQVWERGGLRPNRQIQKPEAGYCLVIRYDERTTNTISHFMAKVRAIIPTILEYRERDLHTTIGTYGKRDLAGFVADSPTLQGLRRAIEKGLTDRPRNLSVKFGRWLYNEEAVLISGYPNQDLWRLCQSIGSACQEDGYPLEMARIVHITAARFTTDVSFQDFERFGRLMKSAPAMESSKPSAIDLAAWRCDGHSFDLFTHQRYCL